MAEKFGLVFHVLDAGCTACRPTRSPCSSGDHQPAVAAHPREQRLLDEVLTPDTRHSGFLDLVMPVGVPGHRQRGRGGPSRTLDRPSTSYSPAGVAAVDSFGKGLCLRGPADHEFL